MMAKLTFTAYALSFHPVEEKENIVSYFPTYGNPLVSTGNLE